LRAIVARCEQIACVRRFLRDALRFRLHFPGNGAR
jgi:hypothetical protein